jgi:hypothetical protein
MDWPIADPTLECAGPSHPVLLLPDFGPGSPPLLGPFLWRRSQGKLQDGYKLKGSPGVSDASLRQTTPRKR